MGLIFKEKKVVFLSILFMGTVLPNRNICGQVCIPTVAGKVCCESLTDLPISADALAVSPARLQSWCGLTGDSEEANSLFTPNV